MESMEIEDSSEPPGASAFAQQPRPAKRFCGASGSRQNQASVSNGSAVGSTCWDPTGPSTSKSQTLSDLPSEVLSGCGPEEVSRPDYKAAIFPRSRPAVPVTEPTPSTFHEEEILDPEDNLYFESDHLALKGNKDYSELLKTIITLQAQRTQGIKDLNELLLAKKRALQDPIAYVARLQHGELPEYPGPQKIAELPEIDWSKYNVAQPDNNMRPQTRHAKTAPPAKNIKPDENETKVLVRGRIYDEGKPQTFNQLWTTDEQRRLEELLIKYPKEDVEMRRWTKIARELGNRTPKQVSSRVQKYFIKLSKAGIPIPGKILKAKNETRKSSSRPKHIRKSTFFPHDQILEEIKRDPAQEGSDESQTGSTSTVEDNPDLIQIKLLRQIKTENDHNNDGPIYHHLGYKCYICNQEPIKNVRWHCRDCLDENVDLCSDCAVAQFEAENPCHPISHRLTDVRPPKHCNSFDTDYLPQNFSTNSYNYLDPNFLPD